MKTKSSPLVNHMTMGVYIPAQERAINLQPGVKCRFTSAEPHRDLTWISGMIPFPSVVMIIAKELKMVNILDTELPSTE